MDRVRVTGFFDSEDSCARAIAAGRAAALGGLRAFAPFASEPILQSAHPGHSPVRLWVLLGGIAGCATGFVLTIGLSAEYPHVTAGMPIVSIPPFVIIAFELTILFGALAGLIGFLVHGGFPQFESAPGYSPRFSDDRFGVVVECAADDLQQVEDVLRTAGALEVTHAPA
ncbi:MAG: DUF3341 domain-containing protein [Candidatus Binatia bacterium]